MLKKILIIVVLVVVIAAVGGYMYRNQLVEHAVEEGGTYALGVTTELGSANLSFSGGSLTLREFTAANPESFPGDEFFSFTEAHVTVDAGSILEDEVVVDSVILDGIRLHLHQSDNKSNFKQILDHARNVDFGSSSESSSQKIKIKRLEIRDIAVSAKLDLAGKTQYEKEFALDNITLTDVGGSDGAGSGEIIARVIKAVTAKAAVQGQGLLSGKLGDSLKGIGESKLEDVKQEAVDKLKDIGGSLLGGDDD